MGSYAFLTVADYPVFSTKNFVDTWRFRNADQRIYPLPANKQNALIWSVDPNDHTIEDQYDYAVSVKTMRKRLDVAGFTLDACKREFAEVCPLLAENAEAWNDTHPNEAAEIYRRQDIDEWISAIRSIIRDPRGLRGYQKPDLSGDPEIFGLLLHNPYYLHEMESYALDLGVPCRTFDCAMRLILEAADETEMCVLDATALVHGGWIDSFDLKVSLGTTTTKFYDTFAASVSDAVDVLTLGATNQILMRLVFSNFITAFETYLSDTAKRYILTDQVLLRRFVETDKAFQRDKKFGLNEVFMKMDTIQSVAEDALDRMVFHNIDNIKSIYENVFLVELQQSLLDRLAASVSIRHDIVHRNGRDLKGKALTLDSQQIVTLYRLVVDIAASIDAQLRDALFPRLDEDE